MNEKTPATDLAQSLRTQGFATAEARHNADGSMHVELTTDDAGVKELQKQGYMYRTKRSQGGAAKVQVFCPIPERFW